MSGVVAPRDAEEVAAVIRAASAAGQTVAVRGGGSKAAWGRTPRGTDLVLATGSLSRVLGHVQGDLTVEVESGVRLAALNAHLRATGQWLPLESPAHDSTIGGLLATNLAGPLRHRYGTPRDLLIGVRLATADGRLVRAGGHVVKNVAGYDLGRLMTGSFGAYAVIVSATFKLTPRPPHSASALCTFADRASGARAACALAASQIEPVALDARLTGEAGGVSPLQVLVRLASTPAVVAAQRADVDALLAQYHPDAVTWLDGEADAGVWASAGEEWALQGSVLGLRWLPARLGALIDLTESLAMSGLGVSLRVSAGVGAGTLAVAGDPARQVQTIADLRARSGLLRHVTVLRPDPRLRDAIDPWAIEAGEASLLLAIKQALDPHGLFAAAQGPV